MRCEYCENKSKNIDVAPKCYFSSKFSTARPEAVKESILQQTGCLHYGRHDIFTFFQNMAQLHIITKTNLSEQNEPVNGNDIAAVANK